MQCGSISKPKWTKKGSKVAGRRIEFRNTMLIFKKTKLKDSGIYTCHGKTKDKIPFQAESEMLVGGISNNNVKLKFVSSICRVGIVKKDEG